MLVKDLFKICNKEKTCDYILEKYINSDIFLRNDEDIKEKIYKEYLKTFEHLSLRPVNIKNNDDKIIICKIKEMDYESGNLDFVYYTFLIKNSEVLKKKELLKETEFDFITGKNLINIFSIEFMDWDDILSIEVSDKSIETYDECELAGELLRLMTLFGFNEDDVLDEKINIIRTLKETSSNKENYKPTDEVFKDLYEKTGMKREKITEEEIEFNRKNLNENRIIINKFIIDTIKGHQ